MTSIAIQRAGSRRAIVPTIAPALVARDSVATACATVRAENPFAIAAIVPVRAARGIAAMACATARVAKAWTTAHSIADARAIAAMGTATSANTTIARAGSSAARAREEGLAGLRGYCGTTVTPYTIRRNTAAEYCTNIPDLDNTPSRLCSLYGSRNPLNTRLQGASIRHAYGTHHRCRIGIFVFPAGDNHCR